MKAITTSIVIILLTIAYIMIVGYVAEQIVLNNEPVFQIATQD